MIYFISFISPSAEDFAGSEPINSRSWFNFTMTDYDFVFTFPT